MRVTHSHSQLCPAALPYSAARPRGRPLCTIIGRLQMSPVIALHSFGFILREQARKNFIA
jgi:hypothetical protein